MRCLVSLRSSCYSLTVPNVIASETGIKVCRIAGVQLRHCLMRGSAYEALYGVTFRRLSRRNCEGEQLNEMDCGECVLLTNALTDCQSTYRKTLEALMQRASTLPGHEYQHLMQAAISEHRNSKNAWLALELHRKRGHPSVRIVSDGTPAPQTPHPANAERLRIRRKD
jgi:hypothetical protein